MKNSQKQANVFEEGIQNLYFFSIAAKQKSFHFLLDGKTYILENIFI